MKRAHLNLGLLVVAAGLGVAVFLSQEQEEKGPPLTALKQGAVTRVAIAHPGASAIRMEKRDGGWFLTEPVQAEVDEFEINAVLSLAEAEAKETLAGVKLPELELEPPRYVVTLDDTAIAFGGVEPLQYRRYVKVGETVSLIEDPPSAALDKDYADLVAKGLVPVGAEIEKIELPKLTLAKADGKWALTPPDPKATADAMQGLAEAWKNARAMWNEPARDDAKGERVRLTLKGGEVREFVVAARDPQFKLQRPGLGVNFVLSKALADEMLALPEPPQDASKSEPSTKPVEQAP